MSLQRPATVGLKNRLAKTLLITSRIQSSNVQRISSVLITISKLSTIAKKLAIF